MRRRSGWGLALLAGCAALAWWYWPTPASGPSSLPGAVAWGGPAASLRGTSPDGAVKADGAGALRVDQELRRLFDYYLATQGERTLPQIRAELQRYLQGRLQAKPLAQAMNLFDRYVAYRQSLAGMTVAASADLSQRLARARAVRLQYFSAAEVAGLFGDEDRYDAFTAQRLDILADPSLSAAEKQRRIALLEQQLPPELRAAREEPVKHLALAEAEAALRQRGGGEQELYQLRASMVGQAAADRLSELDREQAAWRQRVNDFTRERAAILANGRLSAEQQQQAVAQLQAQRFSAQEALRLPGFVASH
ncbi:lipase chaperone [Chromobacterium sinusclupearum]|uniref:Lipase chaperone n=1 Tax=Chromobacterium sinusclupearum TaxID=2077146 RepID=A0A2K4MMC3_9NEIS|nr:lipase secretion chaperone [Chromobacterium sinusclupearum]POA98226.1 lipase chaperone [Chromobacterium sinusclupearum]